MVAKLGPLPDIVAEHRKKEEADEEAMDPEQATDFNANTAKEFAVLLMPMYEKNGFMDVTEVAQKKFKAFNRMKEAEVNDNKAGTENALH